MPAPFDVSFDSCLFGSPDAVAAAAPHLIQGFAALAGPFMPSAEVVECAPGAGPFPPEGQALWLPRMHWKEPADLGQSQVLRRLDRVFREALETPAPLLSVRVCVLDRGNGLGLVDVEVRSAWSALPRTQALQEARVYSFSMVVKDMESDRTVGFADVLLRERILPLTPVATFVEAIRAQRRADVLERGMPLAQAPKSGPRF